jgi:hypothetical protein
MRGGVADMLWERNDVAAPVDAAAPRPTERGPYKKTDTWNAFLGEVR